MLLKNIYLQKCVFYFIFPLVEKKHDFILIRSSSGVLISFDIVQINHDFITNLIIAANNFGSIVEITFSL